MMLQAGAVEDIESIVGAIDLRRGRGIYRQTSNARRAAIAAPCCCCCCCRCGGWRDIAAEIQGERERQWKIELVSLCAN